MLSEHLGHYISLPRELRDQVARYVLVPEHVYIGTAPTTEPNGKHSQHALLQTCKQAYKEGHRTFYSDNTFHLPPGPIERTIEWMASLQSEHQAMINRLVIDFTLRDYISKSEERLRFTEPRDDPEGLSSTAEYNWVDGILTHLHELWRMKLEYLTSWGRLVEYVRPTWEKGASGRRALYANDPDAAELVRRLATRNAEGCLLGFLEVSGFEAAKRALHERKLGLGDISVLARKDVFESRGE